MATIHSNRNDNMGVESNVSFNSTSTWSGAVIPGTGDTVYIVGRRTTINQSAISKWTGMLASITVASTTNYKSSGFFKTQTDKGDFLKINYTGTTSTAFLGCTIDETNQMNQWTTGATIFNGAYVLNPAAVITINSGETFECGDIIITEGGSLLVNPGGTLKLNTGIVVRDGILTGRGNGQIIITRNSQALSASYIGYLNGENYYMSIIDIDGGETRTYGTISSDVSLGSSSITLSDITNGQFKAGDEIAIYSTGNDGYRRRNYGYVGYRDATQNFSGMDEGLDVVGVSGNTLYVAIRNGVRGTIKSTSRLDTQAIINVKPDSIYFNTGDTIIINNKQYTIDKIEDSEYLLYDYDFTNPSTDLSDFWLNDQTHIYSSGWTITNGVGIGTNTGSYRELTHKYFWEREVIVEAEMSPLANYDSGSRSGGRYGIQTSYDPAYRWGHRSDDSFKSDYFQIYDDGDWIGFWIRSVSNYGNNRLSRNTDLRNQTRMGCNYKVETRKGRTITYVNGTEFSTDNRRDGNYRGCVGLVFSNSNAKCRRLKISIPVQKIYITTNDSFSNDSIVYRTGTEIFHPAGRRVVKTASINMGTGNLSDLAFAYRGQNGNGEWPQIIQVNGVNTVNNTLPYIHNHDMNYDYYYDLGNAQTAKSMTIDLTYQRRFTHVSFVPRILDYSTYYGFNGVAIYGSNDLTNWTTLYGPTADTKNFCYNNYNKMAFYPVGNANYRYVKFETKGAAVSPYTNRYINLGVHDFTNGYILSLNNASDLNIGDKLTVLTDSGFNWGARELEAYWSWTSAGGKDPETFYHNGWLPECTIIGKTGDTVSLNNPVWWGYIEDKDSVTVVKTNRNFIISGTMGPTNSTNDWRWPNISLNDGSQNTRRYMFKNIRFNYIGSYRYGGSSTANRGIIIYSDEYWNSPLFENNVHMMGSDSNTWSGIGTYYSNAIMRNSVIIGQNSGMYNYYTSSYSGIALFNNKYIGCYNGIYSEGCRVFFANYNEIACADTGLHLGSTSTEKNVYPCFNQIKYNYMKGLSWTGLNISLESYGPIRMPLIKIENNKVRGGDDYSCANSLYTGIPSVNSNYMAEHTGSRLSRYRNEGHIYPATISSDLTYQSKQQNYGRYNYDLLIGTYCIFESDPLRPGIIRVYNTNGDSFLASMGVEVEVLKNNIPVQIHVHFNYRMPIINRIQDDGTDDGRLRLCAIQNGELREIQYGLVPSTLTDDWATFDGIFSGFTNQEGKISLYLNKSSQNGYTDYKNIGAEVYCDDPTNIRVVANTFSYNGVWDQYNEIKGIKPITTNGTKTLTARRIKF